MNTLNKTITTRFFRNAEDYNRLIALWSCWMRDAEMRSRLTAAHHLLYLILRGRNWHQAFAPVTNARKLENGGVYNWGARKAVHALHYADADALLAPFRDVLHPDALVMIRELVPADNWNTSLRQEEPYHA